MSSILIAVLVFVFVFGGALAGLAIRVPEHHQDAETKDVVKLVMGLVATIAALVLSLLIASAHSSYDRQASEVQELGAQLVQLDQVFAHYGPEANDSRAQLRRMVKVEVERLWPDAGAPRTAMHNPQKYVPAEDLFDTVNRLTPNSEAQRSAQARALQLMTIMGTTIRLLHQQAGGSLSWPFFIVLVFWLVILFAGFGLYARRNATATTALFLGALTVAGAIFLILEMNRPYSGLMEISSAPISGRAAGDWPVTGLGGRTAGRRPTPTPASAQLRQCETAPCCGPRSRPRRPRTGGQVALPIHLSRVRARQIRSDGLAFAFKNGE